MDWVREQWTKLYWFFHGPVGNPQPRAKGYIDMSPESAIRFLMTEGVLAIVMLICIWGIGKLVTDGRLAQLLSILVYVIFGGWMLIVLLRFAGVM
jgi:hypothetical protein